MLEQAKISKLVAKSTSCAASLPLYLSGTKELRVTESIFSKRPSSTAVLSDWPGAAAVISTVPSCTYSISNFADNVTDTADVNPPSCCSLTRCLFSSPGHVHDLTTRLPDWLQVKLAVMSRLFQTEINNPAQTASKSSEINNRGERGVGVGVAVGVKQTLCILHSSSPRRERWENFARFSGSLVRMTTARPVYIRAVAGVVGIWRNVCFWRDNLFMNQI